MNHRTGDGETWCLVGRLKEGTAVREVPVRPLPFRVGRAPKSALCLDSPVVSNQHAEIAVIPGGLSVRDLSSTNGTYVNGARLAEVARVSEGDLVQFATTAFRIGRAASQQPIGTRAANALDEALALVQFERLLEQRAVLPYFQPIVDLAVVDTVGFELLSRSRMYGLDDPKKMFHAAAHFDSEAQLSRMMRQAAVEVGGELDHRCNLFFNSHPAELNNPELLPSIRQLRDSRPSQPMTLEIHEAAFTSVDALHELRAGLLDMEVQLAFDDFGAGQARLLELADARPDYLKFDICLIKDVHRSSAKKQQLVKHLVRMVNELGIVALAEGVETAGEHEFCLEAGFALGQGYYYGRPAPAHQFLQRAMAVAPGVRLPVE